MFQGRFFAEQHMRDILQVGTVSQTDDGYGTDGEKDTWVYDEVNTVPCTVVIPRGERLEVLGGSNATISKIIIRIPYSNTSIPSGVKRVRITHMNRTALSTPIDYDVVGGFSNRPSYKELNCTELVGNVSS